MTYYMYKTKRRIEMYFNKYYSYRTEEYIHKIVMSSKDLFLFRKIVYMNMPDVDYGKLLIKKFDVQNELKYINSPNSIGENALKQIIDSEDKYYSLELTDEEYEELFEELFKCLILYKGCYDEIIEIKKDVDGKLDEDLDDLKKQMQELKSNLKNK